MVLLLLVLIQEKENHYGNSLHKCFGMMLYHLPGLLEKFYNKNQTMIQPYKN